MKIELAILISVVSVSFAIFQGYMNLKRNKKNDDQQDASQLTMVIIKLENIGIGISEIKAELNNVKSDRKEDREKIIRLDESLKSAWIQINQLNQKLGEK